MRLHLIGIFHTQHTAAYSHCAFTGKALRFPKMMQRQGYEVIEYSNAGSEGGADEHVEMMSAEEFADLFTRAETDFHGNDATVGSTGHQLFERRLIPALRERLGPQDIICHPFGHAHSQLMSEFPGHQHVETGIGYPTLMPGSFRIFESYAWMHYHQGKEGRNGKAGSHHPSFAACQVQLRTSRKRCRDCLEVTPGVARTSQVPHVLRINFKEPGQPLVAGDGFTDDLRLLRLADLVANLGIERLPEQVRICR